MFCVLMIEVHYIDLYLIMEKLNSETDTVLIANTHAMSSVCLCSSSTPDVIFPKLQFIDKGGRRRYLSAREDWEPPNQVFS